MYTGTVTDCPSARLTQLSTGSIPFISHPVPFYLFIPEATDRQNAQFGLERVTEVLNGAASADPEVLIRSVQKAVDSFVGSAPQFDDLTMLSLVWHGVEDSQESP